MSKTKPTAEWEQLEMCSGPFTGSVVPLEHDAPNWPDGAWAVVKVLAQVRSKQAALTVSQLGVRTGLTDEDVRSALAVLAPYEAARPVLEEQQLRYRPGRRSRDVMRWEP